MPPGNYATMPPIRPNEAAMWLRDWISHTNGYQRSLISTSRALTMTIGTGFDILCAACDFILEHVEEELIFVTCFWAKSDSLSRISDMLLALSAKGLASKRKIRVRICLSSLSLTQKLFHTWSPRGTLYKSSEWSRKFGIPSENNLTGLELQIQSIFIPPFSVMHSKFIVIDRKVCLLPSCNVSWENWFEGCVDLRGPIVAMFVGFWESFWRQGNASVSAFHVQHPCPGNRNHVHIDGADPDNEPFREAQESRADVIAPFTVKSSLQSTIQDGALPFSLSLAAGDIKAVFLPSPHHQNPRFRPFPCQKPPECPRTLLNTFTLQLLEGSNTSIFMQTPNVTSPPVLAALRRALGRGVSVHIVTNEKLMWLEQLGTAGTTTPWCLSKLIKSYERLQQKADSERDVDGGEAAQRPGKLRIEYFAPRELQRGNSWAVSSHLKLTIVDAETVIVGSGNMDRASWYTSQELGVALLSEDVAECIAGQVAGALKSKVQCMYACRP